MPKETHQSQKLLLTNIGMNPDDQSQRLTIYLSAVAEQGVFWMHESKANELLESVVQTLEDPCCIFINRASNQCEWIYTRAPHRRVASETGDAYSSSHLARTLLVRVRLESGTVCVYWIDGDQSTDGVPREHPARYQERVY